MVGPRPILVMRSAHPCHAERPPLVMLSVVKHLVISVLSVSSVAYAAGVSEPPVTINGRDDGYRGIWYMNQPSGDEYVYKYSGGLGTYCAKHQPFAVYRPQADKTFFCYGGAAKGDDRRLMHMVSYYDHKTGMVLRPTILLDKRTNDAHDNPVISVDGDGHVWVFSTSHGTGRPSYIHKSVRPYDVNTFEQVAATKSEDGNDVPMTNFSYMQAWHVEGCGFACFFTRYNYPADRTICFMSSADGVKWSPWQRLAAMDKGHYQISAVTWNKRLSQEAVCYSDPERSEGEESLVFETQTLRVAHGDKSDVACRAGTAFNYHPSPQGLNWRTNLYYIETADLGGSWRTADGRPVEVPLTDANCAALVYDYRAEGLLVYLKDIRFDGDGRPVILYITSQGYESGPKNDPRTWTTARWTGAAWEIRPAFTSDNNYDMGSLYIEADGSWRVIGPTQPGPQPYNPGGEVAMWASDDQGASWRMVRQLTQAGPFNHTYVRRPVDAHRDFYALWADGHGRQPSPSSLYFCDIEGNVRVLPRAMDGDFAQPEVLEPQGTTNEEP
ncbi:MAG TPA: hypothetical protein ENN81_09535 [Phycisphaerales bacterium]|nr:hypothetical protein [Phycisphaerales bacterium]